MRSEITVVGPNTGLQHRDRAIPFMSALESLFSQYFIPTNGVPASTYLPNYVL